MSFYIIEMGFEVKKENKNKTKINNNNKNR